MTPRWYWIRQPGKTGFRGPHTIADVLRGLRSGDYSFDAEVLSVENPSQTTFAHLLDYSEWVSICTICPPESVTVLPNDQATLAGESVVRLADLRQNSVYPLLRLAVRTAQIGGVLIIVVVFAYKAHTFSGLKVVESAVIALAELLILALVTCPIQMLADIADAQLENRRRS
jgi:hypothetical protein